MGEWERDEGQVGKEKQGKGRVGEKAGDDHNWGGILLVTSFPSSKLARS